jgi:hypothetical protein
MQRTAFTLFLAAACRLAQAAPAFECTYTPSMEGAPTYLKSIDSAWGRSDDPMVIGVLREARRATAAAGSPVAFYRAELEVVEYFRPGADADWKIASFTLGDTAGCESAMPPEQPLILSLSLREGGPYVKTWWPVEAETVELLRMLARQRGRR